MLPLVDIYIYIYILNQKRVFFFLGQNLRAVENHSIFYYYKFYNVKLRDQIHVCFKHKKQFMYTFMG